ncbi:MAG: hypothetical protein AAF572_25420 [Cyanobacteria bacterium P01_B01_bin.77]
MWVTKQASETINRGITAVAMTVAIATIYAGMLTEGQVGRGDGLPHQIQKIQTALKLPSPDLTMPPITQNTQKNQDNQNSQESLATLVMGSQGNRYNYQ